MSTYIPVADRKLTANKRTIKGTSISYPAGRKSKFNPNGLAVPAKYAEKELLARFKEFHGEPNPTRRKRALIAKFNPLHFAFGNTLPIWKTYQTYAQNMGLLETDYEQS